MASVEPKAATSSAGGAGSHAIASMIDVSRPYPDQMGTLGALLRSSYRKMAERIFGTLAAKGFEDIRPAHSALLRHLAQGGNRLTELAAMAGMTKQSMAYLVGDLEQLGYVKMSPDPVDGRAKLVKFTKRGHELSQTMVQTSAEIEARVAARIGKKEMKHLRQLLTELDGVVGNFAGE